MDQLLHVNHRRSSGTYMSSQHKCQLSRVAGEIAMFIQYHALTVHSAIAERRSFLRTFTLRMRSCSNLYLNARPDLYQACTTEEAVTRNLSDSLALGIYQSWLLWP